MENCESYFLARSKGAKSKYGVCKHIAVTVPIDSVYSNFRTMKSQWEWKIIKLTDKKSSSFRLLEIHGLVGAKERFSTKSSLPACLPSRGDYRQDYLPLEYLDV